MEPWLEPDRMEISKVIIIFFLATTGNSQRSTLKLLMGDLFSWPNFTKMRAKASKVTND